MLDLTGADSVTLRTLLDGKAKAMVVVASRKAAVRWQKAIRAYIEKRNYPLGVPP